MKSDYTKLKFKLVLYFLAATALAFLVQNILILIDNAFGTFQKWELYSTLLVVVFVCALSVFFYIIVTKIVKLFAQVSGETDKLLEDSEQPIVLGPELVFLQQKLNKINTALKTQKRTIIESEQRKNDLIVYLAHDIKTPLTSVIGYLNLLNEMPDMAQEQRAKYVGITLEKANRLEQLINELFEIARFNLQNIALQKETINLTFMLQQIADEFYPMLMPQGKQLSVNAPDGLSVFGDADKLARVFNNILKNAVAYSYDNSVIEISAKSDGQHIVITFTNRGDPIPSQELKTIFERFYRLDAARSSATGGAGLGLSIAKEIVTAHGGTIWAESTETLTVFTVTLPCDPEALPA